ncbi:MAG: hypothetical protein LBJ38_01955 [Oscillospiraceae bacterium]|jgi:hypothetical protein|nr:hypothetical protein [Oscillospiraceae bacterium]
MLIKFSRKIVCIWVALVVLCVCFGCSFKVFCTAGYDMEVLVRLAIAADPKLQALRAKLALQQVKRKQALEAIKDIRKKESTVRFSLLLSIKLPEKHGLPKEADLLTKVATIDDETRRLRYAIEDRELEVALKTRLAFLKLYGLQEQIKSGSLDLDSESANLAKMQALLACNHAKPADITLLQSTIDKKTRSLATLKLSLEREAEKLRTLSGVSAVGALLQNPLATCVIPRGQREKMIEFAMAHRRDVREAEAERALAIVALNAIWGVYCSQWGGAVGPLSAYVNSANPINWDVLIPQYEQFLTTVDRPWAPVFKIRIIFFTIRIPMEWFKREFDGTRYFEDEKYMLLEVLQRKEAAIRDEAILKADVRESLTSSYDALMALHKAYCGSVEICGRVKRSYEMVKTKNLVGQATFEEIAQAKEEYDQAQMDVFAALIAYNESLAALDKETCGWIAAFKKGESVLVDIVGSGNSSGVERPRFAIRDNIDSLQSVLWLTIPDGYETKATHYDVVVDGYSIGGGKTELSEQLIFLPPEITGCCEPQVRLFANDKVLDAATFSGAEQSGELLFKVAETKAALAQEAAKDQRKAELFAADQQEEVQLGTYQWAGFGSGGLPLTELSLCLDDEKAKTFKVFVEQDGKAFTIDRYCPLDEQAVLPVQFAKRPEDLKATLYDANKRQIDTVRFDKSGGVFALRAE